MAGSDSGLKCEEALRLVYDMPVGVARLNAACEIVWANQSLCGCLEYSAGQVIGQPLKSLTEPSFYTANAGDFESVREGAKPNIRSVTGLVKAGTIAGKKRIVWGLQHVSRQPVLGEFEYFWLVFVPFDQQDQVRHWTIREGAQFLRENWKWAAGALTFAAALASGNWTEAFRSLRELGGNAPVSIPDNSPPNSSGPPQSSSQ